MGTKEREGEGEMKRVVLYCPAEGETEKLGEVYRDKCSWSLAQVKTSAALKERVLEYNGLLCGKTDGMRVCS